MKVVIDIGGTKTLLALYERCLETNQWLSIKHKKYKSADYNNIADILKDFADQSLYADVASIVVGVAGPVVKGVCHITNLSWAISVHEIRAAVQVEDVVLLNDLEAAAWGINSLTSDDLININPHAVNTQGHKVILSAGTGLGEAMLIQHNQDTVVVASEGGHADFAAQNSEQDKLLCFLRAKYQGHVSYERVISGLGLHNIYQFLREDQPALENKGLTAKITKGDAAAIIGSAGIEGLDQLCQEAVRIFCEIYAAEAANFALKCLPCSGVILAGGITPKLLPMIRSDLFLNAFLNKGRHSALLKNIPIYICLDEDLVLLGGLAY